jgi:hypothetical protein
LTGAMAATANAATHTIVLIISHTALLRNGGIKVLVRERGVNEPAHTVKYRAIAARTRAV